MLRTTVIRSAWRLIGRLREYWLSRIENVFSTTLFRADDLALFLRHLGVACFERLGAGLELLREPGRGFLRLFRLFGLQLCRRRGCRGDIGAAGGEGQGEGSENQWAHGFPSGPGSFRPL